MRAVNYRQAATPSLLLSALTCSECNVCESVACPVGISPCASTVCWKRELRAKNLRYDGPLRPADEMAKHRLVPVKRLISKLGLDPWYQEAPLTAVEPEVACVTPAPAPAYIGISAVPCVAPGERVTRGQVLADIPADALGAPVHASIDAPGLRHHGAGHYACKRLITDPGYRNFRTDQHRQGMELGDVMLKARTYSSCSAEPFAPGNSC